MDINHEQVLAPGLNFPLTPYKPYLSVEIATNYSYDYGNKSATVLKSNIS